MKTLYVTDLDGTLLQSNQTLSDNTIQKINELVKTGVLFSCATARSYHTTRQVIHPLKVNLPLIVYNGVMIRENLTGKILKGHFFEKSIYKMLDELIREELYPVVYSMIEEKECFSYIEELCNKETLSFIDTRKKDPRKRKVSSLKELYEGDIFYISWMGSKESLEKHYQLFKNQYNCLFQKDTYQDYYWLEVMPPETSKAKAIEELKLWYDADKVIVFGDGSNDIPMFQIADESYAVKNAHPLLKEMATEIIDSNDEEAVVKKIEEIYKKELTL